MAETRTWFLFDDARTLADWVVAQAVVDRAVLERPWTVAQLDAGHEAPMLALAPGPGPAVPPVPARLERRVATVQGHVSGTTLAVVAGPEHRTGTYELMGQPRTWSNVAQAVPLVPWRREPKEPEVAFVAASREEFERLVHEHLAVGNADLQVTSVAGRSGRREWLVRGRRASWYVVQRAIQPGRDVRVHWRVPGTSTWVRWGLEHPLVRHLDVPQDDAMLLADRDGWRLVEGGGWQDVADVLDLDVRRSTLAQSGQRPRLEVPLRLEARTEEAMASLWVVPEDGVHALERILSRMDPAQEDQLSLAWLAHESDGRRFLVVRETVPGRSAGPEVRTALRPFAAYAQVAGLVGLHVPSGSTVGPPLRPERLARTLGLERGDVTLVDDSPHGLAITRISESAFQPMGRLVDVLAAMAPEPVRTTLAMADVGDRPFDPSAPGPEGVPRTPRRGRR